MSFEVWKAIIDVILLGLNLVWFLLLENKIYFQDTLSKNDLIFEPTGTFFIFIRAILKVIRPSIRSIEGNLELKTTLMRTLPDSFIGVPLWNKISSDYVGPYLIELFSIYELHNFASTPDYASS